MVRSSVRVPQRQRMAWAVALAAGFVASTVVFTSTPAPVRAPLAGDLSLGGGAASALPMGFTRPKSAAPQAGQGITVLASPSGAKGTLTVSETVRVDAPITSITLSPPTLPTGQGFDQGGVRVTNVVVVADGRTIVLGFSSLQGQRVVQLGKGATMVTVSYVLSGVGRSGGSNTVALQPIASVGDTILAVSYVVAAKSVSLACPNLPTAVQSACTEAGSPSGVAMLTGLASTQSTLLITLTPPTGGSTTTPGGGPVEATGPTSSPATGPTGGTTPDSGSTGAAATGGSGDGAPATAGSDPTSTATSGGTPTGASTPTDSSTGSTATGTPTDGSTGSTGSTGTPPPDPTTTTTTVPDPTASDPSPVTLPTGTPTDGTEGTPGTATGQATGGSSAQTAGAGDATGASAAAASSASASSPVTSQQPVSGTGDAAPVVAPDPSSGPSTETVGAADPVAPAATPADPAPVTDPTPATDTASPTPTAPAADSGSTDTGPAAPAQPAS